MILNCPACGTRYLIDPAVLGARGRHVRCARCSESWHQRPPEDMPKPLPPPPIAPDPLPRRANLPAIRVPARRSAAPAWIALVLIFATLGGVGFFAGSRSSRNGRKQRTYMKFSISILRFRGRGWNFAMCRHRTQWMGNLRSSSSLGKLSIRPTKICMFPS